MSAIQMTKEYVLDIAHIDSRGLARPSAILEFMQDLATIHGSSMGWSGEELRKHNCFWVLSRIKYQLNRPLRSYEKIRLTTLPREIKGASWYRDFIIEAEEGVIGYAVTVWAIVNIETRRLVRPKTIGLGFEKQDTGLTELLKSLPAEQLESCFQRVVRYSDIDLNRHLNNVKTVDILSDAFGLEENEKLWVSQLQVNFISESSCGTVLDIRRGRGKENSLCTAAFAGEQEKVQAEVVFSSL